MIHTVLSMLSGLYDSLTVSNTNVFTVLMMNSSNKNSNDHSRQLCVKGKQINAHPAAQMPQNPNVDIFL